MSYYEVRDNPGPPQTWIREEEHDACIAEFEAQVADLEHTVKIQRAELNRLYGLVESTSGVIEVSLGLLEGFLQGFPSRKARNLFIGTVRTFRDNHWHCIGCDVWNRNGTDCGCGDGEPGPMDDSPPKAES